MTPAQKHALEELRYRGGEGAIDKYGVVVAGGVRLKFLADTWLRLMTTGHVESRGPMRLGLTALGIAATTPVAPKANPHIIRRPRGPMPACPGAE